MRRRNQIKERTYSELSASVKLKFVMLSLMEVALIILF
jgi:ribosomal protein L20A (L18A)